MDMNAARLAMACELEMMMFEICQAVAHILLAADDLLMPQCCSSTFDPHRAGDFGEGSVDDELRAQAAGAQLRACEVEVIPLLEFVIRELVALCDADAKGTAIGRNDVNAGEF